MRTGPFKTRTRGSHSSLPLAAWSVRRVTARASLSEHPLIEKTDYSDSKLPLYLRKRGSYCPRKTRAARLALTLRQTYKEENMRMNSAERMLLSLFLNFNFESEDRDDEGVSLRGRIQ
jgi:hypothetical protein